MRVQTLPHEIVERCAEAKIPVGLSAAGHRIAMNDEVDIRILHPSEEFYSDKDNPFSLVAAVEYHGRKLLLTGDLEGDGLGELLRQPPWDCDVMLSPHHGSKAANPEQLARWATPEWVVISTQDADAEQRLGECYSRNSHMLATARHGALEFRISPHGTLTVESFRGGLLEQPLK